MTDPEPQTPPPQHQRYYSGDPRARMTPRPSGDDEQQRKSMFKLAAVGVGLLVMGSLLGTFLAAEPPEELARENQRLRLAITQKDRVIEQMRQQLVSQGTTPALEGALDPKARERHLRQGNRLVEALRKRRAQPASDLVAWFIGRWNDLLDQPRADDRIDRRAELLAKLVGGMGENLHPEDYVPWQAEFLSGDWLGELHYDLDGDGLPGKRSSPNTHDSFAATSICQVAMALNQAMTDARVLVMPEMRCDRAEARLSVFLHGKTFDDALNTFVRTVREEGFIALEKKRGTMRLVLIGPRQ